MDHTSVKPKFSSYRLLILFSFHLLTYIIPSFVRLESGSNDNLYATCACASVSYLTWFHSIVPSAHSDHACSTARANLI